ncbi:MAG: tRNA threonylcarbamoyladenosine dehydratase [Tannerella sp.]|nr:tRNA threonylcarbamoyladenosine dehydratase [Tannerella sp.]
MYREKDIFSRNELLMGSEMMDKISEKRVILFGVGGVGSWCAESLIRSGIGHLTIVDSDLVGVSNINRQLPATTETVGQVKVEVLKRRLLSINPHADITAIQSVYSAETAASFRLDNFDYIIDAIDSLQHKAHLIATATRTKATFFSSMGAAVKVDPSRIKTAEFQKVQGCPLAAALRRRLKKTVMPAKKFLCVFSDEILPNKESSPTSSKSAKLSSPEASMPPEAPEQAAGDGQSAWDKRKARINGTMVHITAIFGFMLAGLVIRDINKS